MKRKVVVTGMGTINSAEGYDPDYVPGMGIPGKIKTVMSY